jgi:hypothetical protein
LGDEREWLMEAPLDLLIVSSLDAVCPRASVDLADFRSRGRVADVHWLVCGDPLGSARARCFGGVGRVCGGAASLP